MIHTATHFFPEMFLRDNVTPNSCQEQPKPILYSYLFPKIIIAIIMIPIIFDVTERPIGAPLFHIFCYTDCPSVTPYFPSYITARAVLIHPDNDLL